MKTKGTKKSVGREKGFKWAYKVVKPAAGLYRSAWMPPGKFAVTYEIGEETVAPVGGLLVFGTLGRAREWNKLMFSGTLSILKVKAYDPVPIFKAAKVFMSLSKSRLEEYWNSKTTSEDVKIHGYNWPEGTLAFRRIIPTKEMK